MSLAELLAQNMNSKLQGDSFDTKKDDKKNKKEVKSSDFLDKKEHNLVFLFEKRNGKPVTLIGKFFLDESSKKELLKVLKSKLACGGAIKDDYIELQGDFKAKAKEILQNLGWRFKK